MPPVKQSPARSRYGVRDAESDGLAPRSTSRDIPGERPYRPSTESGREGSLRLRSNLHQEAVCFNRVCFSFEYSIFS